MRTQFCEEVGSGGRKVVPSSLTPINTLRIIKTVYFGVFISEACIGVRNEDGNVEDDF